VCSAPACVVSDTASFCSPSGLPLYWVVQSLDSEFLVMANDFNWLVSGTIGTESLLSPLLSYEMIMLRGGGGNGRGVIL
jgi:hypothetical protein